MMGKGGWGSEIRQISFNFEKEKQAKRPKKIRSVTRGGKMLKEIHSVAPVIHFFFSFEPLAY